LCALDVLSASGLVNYFGRLELPGGAVNDAEAVHSGLAVRPVLLQKGTTKLALYGMGNIRDERFHHEMQNGRIRLVEPVEDHEEYFNLLLVHQNRYVVPLFIPTCSHSSMGLMMVAHGTIRVPRGVKNYVADTAFGDEAHLIVWGHEHDCIEKAGAVPVTGRKYYITQPGSSVATSLAAGEAIPKSVLFSPRPSVEPLLMCCAFC
jgi:double-strand break repair protein MRE11